ncbi:invasin domain 3-containing protein [Muriicola marianensis]|uniref:Big-1 domain-containing protein n=1 Tax=Muriicola marianensis TaxID=1324801 RepID=A0ABQ1QT38_9FLAO|nr:invasin domain 3-containing protein [Muriicola marianensis]GGD40832.1 hypothetical protein GCM10011361_04950 [Muriicola marianensis]
MLIKIHRICLLAFLFISVYGSAQVQVTATAGTASGNYPTLKSAFDQINNGNHRGDITIEITSDLIETSTATLDHSGSGPSNYSSILITPSGGATRTISGNLGSSGLIHFNGADNVTIDGLKASGNALTFRNDNTGAPTIRFSSTNNATQDNIIENCTVLGSNTSSSSGVIQLQWANSNQIINNEIGPSGSNYPTNLIYAGYYYYGDSDNNTISGNHLFDYGNPNSTQAAAVYAQYAIHWSITDNRIYQSTPKSFTNTNFRLYYGIYLRDGSGHQVNNNIIGYADASANGTTDLNFTGANSSVDIYPIFLTSDGTDPSTIDGNTISGFAVNGSTEHINIYPIFYEGTYGSSYTTLRTASIANNIIGSATNPNAITLSTTGYMRIRGIMLGNPGSSLNYLYDVDITGNSIGGISIPTTASPLGYFNGISTKGYQGSTVTVSGNTIGFPGAPVEIGDTPTANQFSYSGIYVAYMGYEHVTIDQNLVQNLRSYSTTYDSNGIELFKYNPSNAYTITGNTIRDLQGEDDLSGIRSQYNPSGSLYSGNTVYNLSSTKNAYGLYLGEKNSIIENNMVHSLVTTSGTGAVAGIYMRSYQSPVNTVKNNIVSLGQDVNGTPLENVNIYGIFDNTNGASSDYYFNTVSIHGSGSTGNLNSYAFYRLYSNYNSVVKNNIFANYRTNNGGSGKHYAIRLRNNMSMTLDHNRYHAASPDGVLADFNGTDRATLADWQGSTGQDSNSSEGDPQFVEETSIDPFDYFPGSVQAGETIAGISTDFKGALRNDPPSVGAIEGLYTINSTITVTPDTLPADGSSTALVLVQLIDENNTPLATGGAVVDVTASLGTLSPVTDNGDGTYTATLTSPLTTGTATLTFTVNGFKGMNSASATFTAGSPDTVTSTITATPISVPADGLSTSSILVQLFDSNSNPITSGGETVVVSSTLGTVSAVTDLGDGSYSAVLTSDTVAGIAEVSFTINGDTANASAQVEFTAGTPDPATATITASPTSIVADGMSTANILIQLFDTHNNPILSGGETVVVTSTLESISAVTDLGDGTYSAVLTSGTATGNAELSFTINGEAATATTTVEFTAGAPDPSTATISVSPTNIVADGISTSNILIQLFDSNNNPISSGGETIAVSSTLGTVSDVTDLGNGSYSAVLTSGTVTGNAELSFTIIGDTATATASVEFTAGAPDTSTATISASPTNIVADGTSTSNILIQLFDSNDNPISSGGETIAVSSTLGTVSDVTDLGNGSYSAVLTSGTVAGYAEVSFSINGDMATATAVVEFIAGIPDPMTANITANPTSITADGTSTSNILIQLFDSNNNPILSGGENVVVSSTLGAISDVTDLGDGSYSAVLTSGTVTGNAEVSFTINGDQATATESVEFTAGAPDPTMAAISASPTSIMADGVSTSDILIQLFDSNNNPITSGGEAMLVFTTLGSVSTVTDLGNGSYSAVLTSGTVAGDAILSFTINGINSTSTVTVTFTPYDSDGDGIPDSDDNCPDSFNPAQEDLDGDGLGDGCDPDMDGDGVLNTEDECQASAPGVAVDARGCEIFTLPVSNYQIEVASPSCTLEGDGAVEIRVQDTQYTYVITISGRTPIQFDASLSSTLQVSGLTTGTYQVCIGVMSQPNYEECFEITIQERSPLDVSYSIDKDSRELSLDLSGADNYRILINGVEEISTSNRFTKILPSGLHHVEVFTDWDCQGRFEAKVFVPLRVTAHPNPTSGPTQVYIPGTDTSVSIYVYNPEGVMVSGRSYQISTTRYVDLNLAGLASGIYVVHIRSASLNQNFKIIKQ